MYYSDELYHHGIKGQKWGVRRFQNADGSLTDAGRKRVAKYQRKADKIYKGASTAFKAADQIADKYNKSRFHNSYLHLTGSDAMTGGEGGIKSLERLQKKYADNFGKSDFAASKLKDLKQQHVTVGEKYIERSLGVRIAGTVAAVTISPLPHTATYLHPSRKYNIKRTYKALTDNSLRPV